MLRWNPSVTVYDLIFYLYVIVASISNFVPQLLGYSLQHGGNDSEMASFYDGLSSFQFKCSLVSSIATSFPIILDFILDFVWSGNDINKTNNNNNNIVSTGYVSYRDFLPPRILYLALTIPDLIMLIYMIPYKNVDLFPGLYCSRDSFFTCIFFYYMYKLGITDFWSVFLVSILFSTTNILAAVLFFIPDENINFLMTATISSGFLCLFRIYFLWFRDFLTHEAKRTDVKSFICSIYAISILIFLIADWVPVFIPNIPFRWTIYGGDYLTLYTYLMAACTVTVTVISFRLMKKAITEVEMRQSFIRYISHEVRTPLNITLIGLELFEKELSKSNSSLSSNVHVTIKEIKDSCHAAVDVLNNILLYDKIVNGKMVMELERTAVWPLLVHNMELMQLMARASGVNLTLPLPLPATTTTNDATTNQLISVMVMSDPHKLSQVIRNLISNAIKFTPKEGKVTVNISFYNEDNCDSHIHRNNIITSNSNKNNNDNNNNNCNNSHTRQYPPTTYKRYSKITPSSLLQICVTDTGVGLSKENQSKLFHEFFQVNPGKLQGGGGSGLGLWLSSNLVKGFGGTISVYSEGEGYGSTFIIQLPIISSDPHIIPDPESQSVPLPIQANDIITNHILSDESKVETALLPVPLYSSSISYIDGEVVYETHPMGTCTTILVVDDSSLNRKMMCRLLSQNNRMCIEACDGVEAVEIIKKSITQQNRIDTILMDFQMPNMDGPTATAIIRSLGWTRPIIGISGNVLSSDITYFIQHGADIVLSKPLDVMNFETQLERVLERNSHVYSAKK